MKPIKTVSATGAINYQKLAKFAYIPADVLQELAEQFGKGDLKYPPDANGVPNVYRGMDWQNLVHSAERHLNSWKQGDDIDSDMDEFLHLNFCDDCIARGEHRAGCLNIPETYHLTAAIWNLMMLLHFQLNNKGTDYREAWRG